MQAKAEVEAKMKPKEVSVIKESKAVNTFTVSTSLINSKNLLLLNGLLINLEPYFFKFTL